MSSANIATTIFIHSSFRTSSTWMWSKFRASHAVVAYYEYFHERLDSITVDDVKVLRPSAWLSGHPDVEPYFIEYVPLLRPSGGIDGFQQRMSLATFFPRNGYYGALSKAEEVYIKLLINNASRLRRTPFFCCKRTLGRARALKLAIGGIHLVLRRKLLHQWQSYVRQAKHGNPYFLNVLLQVIALNKHEPYMAILHTFIRERSGVRNYVASSNVNEDDLFVVFIAFHFYLYVLTLNDADLVIKTSELVNEDYRHGVERTLTELTGLRIDLSDAREATYFPPSLPIRERKVRMEIERLATLALRQVDESISPRNGGRQLLDEIWGELMSGSDEKR